MIKLAVFDLDDTLALVGKPITKKCVGLLNRLEGKGVRIVVSSGKPVYYQIGMFRQVGLRKPIFIGENGSSIAFGVDLPPEFLNEVKPGNDFIKLRNKILQDVSQICGDDVWLQPNEVMLTLFFKNENARDLLKEYFRLNNFKGAVIYEHVDSFDVVPYGVDKKASLEILGRRLGITKEEMVAVGDGANDMPMFEYCKYSIGLYGLDKSVTTYHYDNPEDALKKILRMTKNDK